MVKDNDHDKDKKQSVADLIAKFSAAPQSTPSKAKADATRSAVTRTGQAAADRPKNEAEEAARLIAAANRARAPEEPREHQTLQEKEIAGELAVLRTLQEEKRKKREEEAKRAAAERAAAVAGTKATVLGKLTPGHVTWPPPALAPNAKELFTRSERDAMHAGFVGQRKAALNALAGADKSPGSGAVKRITAEELKAMREAAKLRKAASTKPAQRPGEAQRLPGKLPKRLPKTPVPKKLPSTERKDALKKSEIAPVILSELQEMREKLQIPEDACFFDEKYNNLKKMVSDPNANNEEYNKALFELKNVLKETGDSEIITQPLMSRFAVTITLTGECTSTKDYLDRSKESLEHTKGSLYEKGKVPGETEDIIAYRALYKGVWYRQERNPDPLDPDKFYVKVPGGGDISREWDEKAAKARIIITGNPPSDRQIFIALDVCKAFKNLTIPALDIEKINEEDIKMLFKVCAASKIRGIPVTIASDDRYAKALEEKFSSTKEYKQFQLIAKMTSEQIKDQVPRGSAISLDDLFDSLRPIPDQNMKTTIQKRPGN